jgi:LPS O-antigen subunit length determinant protein (WzzB/FepE family)
MDEPKEVTVNSLLLKATQLVAYLKLKWKLLLLASIAGALIGVVYTFVSKPKYTGRLTFVLFSENQTNMLAGLAGQFGINIGNVSSGAFEGDNIIELLKSKKIIQGALFKPLPGTNTILINDFITKESLLKTWQKKKNLSHAVPFPSNVNQLLPVQDSLVNEIHQLIVKNYLTVEKVDKKLSYYKISTHSTNEKFSVYLPRFLAEEASKFFIETKTKTATANLNLLQHEADSLRNLLGGSIVAAASEADKTFNLNPAFQVQRSAVQKSQMRSQVLATAYAEVVKNLELAKITLAKETPLYQLVDVPSIPLKKEMKSKAAYFVVGAVIGFLIMALWLLLQLGYRSFLKN